MRRPKDLREYVEASGETLTSLAQRLAISKGFLCNIANGRKRPSPELAEKISRKTGISFKSLLLGKPGTRRR